MRRWQNRELRIYNNQLNLVVVVIALIVIVHLMNQKKVHKIHSKLWFVIMIAICKNKNNIRWAGKKLFQL